MAGQSVRFTLESKAKPTALVRFQPGEFTLGNRLIPASKSVKYMDNFSNRSGQFRVAKFPRDGRNCFLFWGFIYQTTRGVYLPIDQQKRGFIYQTTRGVYLPIDQQKRGAAT